MRKVAVIMDPIENINALSDTSFALMLEAQARDWEVYYLQTKDIWLQEGIVWGHLLQLKLNKHSEQYFEILNDIIQPLTEMDCILVRKDPPFDSEYLYLTHLLEHVEVQDVLIINRPIALRNANEKLFTSWFPQCCPKTLVSSNHEVITEFVEHYETCVIKPLDGLGGRSIFKLEINDPNLNSIIESVTQRGTEHVMVQEFIPAIAEVGDKRIFLINGKAAPFALARIPATDDFRGNLAAGGNGTVVELNDRDYWIAEQIGASLVEQGLYFVGIDVIGDYLTEINVTSPSLAPEIEGPTGFNVCEKLFDFIEIELGAVGNRS